VTPIGHQPVLVGNVRLRRQWSRPPLRGEVVRWWRWRVGGVGVGVGGSSWMSRAGCNRMQCLFPLPTSGGVVCGGESLAIKSMLNKGSSLGTVKLLVKRIRAFYLFQYIVQWERLRQYHKCRQLALFGGITGAHT